MKIIAIGLLFFCTVQLFGQELSPDIHFVDENSQFVEGIRCGTVDTAPADMLRAPADLREWASQHPRQETTTLMIPVAFHIITNTSGDGMVPMWQLQAQIDTLNSAYAPSGIGFQIVQVDTTTNNAWYTVDYNSSEEIAMKQALAIDPTHTLNFYLANLGGGLLGWAVFPWMYSESHFMHGVIVLYFSLPGGTAYPYNEGDTGTHEIGHYLGLFHTFQNGCAPPGDEVDDTPYESSPAYDCIDVDTCPADSGMDPIHNYMDYTDDECMFEFTSLQTVRIDWAMNTYKPGLLVGAIATPASPTNLTSYSDYTTPTSMLLTWDNPHTLTNGDTLYPGYFHIHIERDGIFIDSVPGSVEQFVDTGLVDGQKYFHTIYTRLDSISTFSDPITVSWTAGGSPRPNPPTEFNIKSHQTEVTLRWRNPNTNIDGTPMDDFAGVNVYQSGDLLMSLARSSADTAKADSVTFTPSSGSSLEWYLSAFDNENQSNESAFTNTVITPLNVPILDNFAIQGEPNPHYWKNYNADINDRALNMPSEPYALNFNGMPVGGDTIELFPIDLSYAQESAMAFSYFYQPQGTGNAPETSDSLQIYFKNDLGNWILVRAYPGVSVQPFQQEIIDLETAPNGGGSYFYSQFQIMIKNRGAANPTTPNDDWFIDNIYLGLPIPIIVSSHDSLFFDSTLVGDSSNMAIEIQNIGIQPLVVSELLGSGGTFGVDSASFTVDPASSQEVNITFSPQTAGNFAGLIQFVSNDPQNDTLSLFVQGTGKQITGIAKNAGLPTTYGISPNYPNPFNPTTTIKYQLPQNSEVVLLIYNILGQKVRTLLDKRVEVGYHSIEWNGRNDYGIQVGSGIYIYRFRAGDFQKIQKMIMMK